VRGREETRVSPWSLPSILVWCSGAWRRLETLTVEGVLEHWNLRCLVNLMGKVLCPGPRTAAFVSGRDSVTKTSLVVWALRMSRPNKPAHIVGAINTTTAIRGGTKPLWYTRTSAPFCSTSGSVSPVRRDLSHYRHKRAGSVRCALPSLALLAQAFGLVSLIAS
jgi:hypothetical protein